MLSELGSELPEGGMDASETPIREHLDLDRVLSSPALVPWFQPIVDLKNLVPAAYEALARWPDVPGATPDIVFPAAAAAGRLAELDWACRMAAIRSFLEVGYADCATLFVNVEAATVGAPGPPGADALFTRASDRMHVVIELTERALTTSPADLLALIGWARERGMGIALDDVGAEPDSLAMLPFVAPDVIKLDLELIQRTPTTDQARTMAGVMAHAEATGAAILAEGIETEAHLEQALAFGARYGQGFLFGSAAPSGYFDRSTPMALMHASAPIPGTPFDLVAGTEVVRIGRRSVLLAMSHHLEGHAALRDEPPVLLAAFQSIERFTPGMAARFEALSLTCQFVAALGRNMPETPAPGVRGGHLELTDPLAEEWTVVVVGPHYAGALIARELPDQREDDPNFEFVITHHRPTVIAAGRSLMKRVVPVY